MISDICDYVIKLPRNGLPGELHWTDSNGDHPVRMKRIRTGAARREISVPSPSDVALVHGTGPARLPFDFSMHMRRLCADIVTRCEEFHHIDVGRLLFVVLQARTNRTHGLQAKVTPMRFPSGESARNRRGRIYQVQRYWVAGVEMLYIISFCLPRFLDRSFDDKFITIFHELYHIAPAFNGDLRRHQGRYCIHTHSQKGYDAQMKELARAYLQQNPDPSLFAFLRLNSRQLELRHGVICGLSVPAPRLIPVAASDR